MCFIKTRRIRKTSRELTAQQKAETLPRLQRKTRAEQQSFWESQGSMAAQYCEIGDIKKKK